MSFKSQSAFGRVGNLTFRSRAVKVLTFAILLVLASAAIAGERVGRFCPDCRNQASAQRVAVSTAEASFADGESGGRIFVINHLTGQLFAFNVSPGNSRPRAVLSRMSPDERAVAEAIIELRSAWEEFVRDLGALLLEAGLIGNALKRSPVSFASADPSCPVGTALDFHLAPHLMADIISQINELATATAETRLDFMTGTSFRVDRLGGVGVMMPTGGFAAQWEPRPARGNPLFVKKLDQSETVFNEDRLVFELGLHSATNGQVFVNSEFVPELSRVAGLQIPDFEAGAQLDPCSAQKVLGAAQDSGATFHLPPHDPNPSPFPTNVVPPGAGIDRRICTRTFGVRADGQMVSTHTIKLFCDQAAS